MDKETVIKTIEQINTMFGSVSSRRFTGALFMVFNVLLFGLLNVLVSSPLDDTLDKVEALIDEENRMAYQPLGLYIVSPRKTGLLHVRSVSLSHQY